MENENCEDKDTQKMSVVADDKCDTQQVADDSAGSADDNVGAEDKPNTSDDAVDGFFIRSGKYNPRKLEVETWGDTVGQCGTRADTAEDVFYLLENTSADPRWRSPLRALLADTISDTQIRQHLVSMLGCLQTAITTIEDGGGESRVYLEAEESAAPCPTWRAVLTEVGLRVTDHPLGPGHVTLSMDPGSGKNIGVLRGLHRLLLALQGISPTNHNYLKRLSEKDALHLCTVMTYLETGGGIHHGDKNFVEELGSSCPYLMTSLGFKEVSDGPRLWERPQKEEKVREYRNLVTALQGLYLDVRTVRTDL